ncbi:MAG TPA: hypothetical protein GX710_07345, partial [Clostridiales bacterium]|nr:hypothetical protein [Clostridiales bacterium]
MLKNVTQKQKMIGLTIILLLIAVITFINIYNNVKGDKTIEKSVIAMQGEIDETTETTEVTTVTTKITEAVTTTEAQTEESITETEVVTET